MAGGKLTPRQKMINLMYLVFIAMLALNMSKEVLSAFGLMNEKFEVINSDAKESNAAIFDQLKSKAEDAPAQFKGPYEIAVKVKPLAEDLFKLQTDIDSDSDSPASDSIQSFQLLRSVAAAVVVVNVLVLSRCFPASESHALISHFLPSADTTSTRLRVHSRSWLPPFIAQACNCAGRHDTKTRHGPRSIQIHAL